VDEAAVRVVVEAAQSIPEGAPSTTSPTQQIGGKRGGNCSSSLFSVVSAAKREEEDKARRASSRDEMRGDRDLGGATGGSWEEVVTPLLSGELETHHQAELCKAMLRGQQALARSMEEASAMVALMSQSMHSELADVKRSLLTLQQDVDVLKADSTRRAALAAAIA